MKNPIPRAPPVVVPSKVALLRQVRDLLQRIIEVDTSNFESAYSVQQMALDIAQIELEYSRYVDNFMAERLHIRSLRRDNNRREEADIIPIRAKSWSNKKR